MPESLPKAITEPEKVIAPMAAPRNSSSRLPAGMGGRTSASPTTMPPGTCAAKVTSRGLGTMPKAHGSATAATAMNTAARPIMLCMKATSSGILVICTRLAITAPAAPPKSSAPNTHTSPRALPPSSLTMSAAVVSTAIAMPVMPKMLPRIEVVGCDSPLSAWMKKTLAIR